MNVPDTQQCLSWLKQAKVPATTIQHTTLVALKAVAIAHAIQNQGHMVILPVVKAGALLHDIYRHKESGPLHGYYGARWLRKHNCPEAICLCVQNHILAGFTSQELPKKHGIMIDLIPISIEEKIVAHADNITGRNGPRSLTKLIAKLSNKGTPNNIVDRIIELHHYLSILAGCDLEEL